MSVNENQINASNWTLFFDGVCNTCNAFVDFLLKNPQANRIRFASLQSEFAEKELRRHGRDSKALDTVVLEADGRLYIKSQAIFKILSLIGGGWSVLGVFQILPTALTDLAYDAFAANRYRLFGKKDTCRLPLPEERARFIQ